LLEIHTDTAVQTRLARRGYRVYNFVLPLLILHTILNHSSSALKAHLSGCPRNQITMLDCHDGIPVQPDINGVLDAENAKRIVMLCEERGANISKIYSREHVGLGELDAHQINCTYYSALNCNEDAYLAARAIQFFSPGIPQVYYVGLLAGENTPWEVELQSDPRAINRHNFSEDEIMETVKKPVVQRLLRLIHFRNDTQVFNGEFEMKECRDEELVLAWKLGKKETMLRVDLVNNKSTITSVDDHGRVIEYIP
jgi:sucrose phosphorylase